MIRLNFKYWYNLLSITNTTYIPKHQLIETCFKNIFNMLPNDSTIELYGITDIAYSNTFVYAMILNHIFDNASHKNINIIVDNDSIECLKTLLFEGLEKESNYTYTERYCDSATFEIELFSLKYSDVATKLKTLLINNGVKF